MTVVFLQKYEKSEQIAKNRIYFYFWFLNGSLSLKMMQEQN